MIEKLYLKILTLYPEDFNQTFRDEMVVLFTNRLEDVRENGLPDIIKFLTREFVSVLLGSIKEHLERKKNRRGEIEMKISKVKIDPRIRGALIVGAGFALSQTLYFQFRQTNSSILHIMADFLTTGLVALTLPEAISLAIGVFFIFEISLRFMSRSILSIIMGLMYLIGIVLFYKNAVFIGQIIQSEQPLVWQAIRFGTIGLIGLLVGYVLEYFLTQRFKPGVITRTIGLGFFTGELFGYGLFLLYNLLLGTSPYGPWPHPAYLYMLTLQGLGKGLILGFSFGYIQSRFVGEKFHITPITA